MCKELSVILVNKVVDPKRIIGKIEGRGGGEAQGVGDQIYMYIYLRRQIGDGHSSSLIYLMVLNSFIIAFEGNGKRCSSMRLMQSETFCR
jgi:hypothetical protein